MSAKRFAKPERPRLRRRTRSAEQWLILEPARLGAVGGALCALLTLIVNFARHLGGSAVAPGSVIVAALLSFVVGYALVGIFVWYLLWVAEGEWPDHTATHPARLGRREEHTGGAAPVEADAEAPHAPHPEPEE